MSQLFTSQTELEEFAACFSGTRNHKDLRTSIKRLPGHLRYSKTDLVLHKTGYKGNERYNYIDRPSCSVHKWIDSIAVSKVFESLRTELADAVQEMGKYVAVFGPDECMTVHRVAVIQEMWVKSWPDGVSNERWRYQADQCEACMLSRLAAFPTALRELRTLFLANARKKFQELHQPQPQPQPIILTFVEEWIKLTDQARILFDTSEERAREISKCILHKKLQEAEEAKNKEAVAEAKKKQARNSQDLEILLPLTYNLTPPVTQDVPSPLFSSTITRPMSRNGYELTEAQFLREFSPHNKSFYRTSSTVDDDGSSAITDIYSDNDTQRSTGLSKTLADLQKQQIEDQYRANERGGGGRNPDTGLSSRLYGPWSSTDEIRGSYGYSRFSQTTVSSPGSYRRRSEIPPPVSPLNESNHPRTPDTYNNRTPVSPLHSHQTPDRYNTMMLVSPLAKPRASQDMYMPPPKTPKTPDRSRMLLPIPDMSPFSASPIVSASSSRTPRPASSRAHISAVSPEYGRVSTFSPGEEVVGQQLTMTKAQGRMVNVRAAREERYRP